jgi:pilus assembly protein Flp/PilA
MPKLKIRLWAIWADSSGATAIEYALIGSLISIVIVGALVAINGSMVEIYDTIQDYIVPALEGTGPEER